MIKTQLLIDKLLSWEYYQNKFPLYLQNSYGFLEHFYMLWEILTQLDLAGAQLLSGFDVFNPDYLDYIAQYTPNDENFDLLDKLGYIYGINRNFDIPLIEEPGTKSLSLNNRELLTLLLAKIILSNFEGTYENYRKLYDLINLPIYVFKDTDEASVKFFMDILRMQDITQNMIDMFLAGMYTLESMGITYTYSVLDLSTIATWDSLEIKKSWDKGLWS